MNNAFLAVLAVLLPIMAVFFVLSLLLIKFIWGWTIPDLFPGAVAQGLIAKDISWFTAIKLAIFISFFAGIAKSGGERRR